MKINLLRSNKEGVRNFNTIIKKNLELVFLVCTALSVIVLAQLFNLLKDQRKDHFFEILNNIYFEKTINNVIENLEPKYINIEHKILHGDSFNSILEKYEIPKSEINSIIKILSKRENLKKLKKNQVIKFTFDNGSSKKITSLIYPVSRTKKILT